MGILDWKIPRLWPDSKIFLIGGGPSLNDEDLTILHNQRCIGVNNAFMLGSWIDAMYFGDCRWYEWNHEELKKFGGLKITSCMRVGLRKWPGILQVQRKSAKGICKNPIAVRWNNNSGASAINVAYHLGAKIVVLVAFDMMDLKEGDNHNWHDYHNHIPPPDIYSKRFLKVFSHIRKDADKLGFEIINANPNSGLEDFPKMTLKEAISYGT